MYEITDITDGEESVWPPGPYLTPMSIYGCPESYNHGWREGYISVSWNKSLRFSFVNGYHGINSTNYTEQIKVYKFTEWPSHQTITLGPYTKVGMKLNFCFKQRNNSVLDKGVWPIGTYGIYAKEQDCPNGKISFHHT
jgi:hypothetical protein